MCLCYMFVGPFLSVFRGHMTVKYDTKKDDFLAQDNAFGPY
jgi:hypothetical protein